MLKQTQKGHTIVQCRLEDASQMAFNDNEFELGIISFALHEKPGEIARKIVQEAFRVIKPGGYLLVVDYMLDRNVVLLKELAPLLKYSSLLKFRT